MKPKRRSPMAVVYVSAVCMDCQRKFEFTKRYPRIRCISCTTKHGLRTKTSAEFVAKNAERGETTEHCLDRKANEWMRIK